jgi:hypothetical protein
MTLANDLRKSGAKDMKVASFRAPVWEGPTGEGFNGGITFSLLSRFLNCRERFRLLVVEGLRGADSFNHRVEYGNLWHVCEEAHAANKSHLPALAAYCRRLCEKYRMPQEQIDQWYNVCKIQFPLYVDYWSKHPDVTARTPLLQEHVFDVPYSLPSGRTVRLRGKWDSVDLIGTGKGAGIYLMENKTKGDIREGQIRRQLSFDLQTMLYLVALSEYRGQLKRDVLDFASDEPTPGVQLPSSYLGQLVADLLVEYSVPLLGVRYNVVRRPLTGGVTGSIRQRKGESRSSFYERLSSIIKADLPSYFARWKVEISPDDVARFRRECLDPILEQLCDWWEWITAGVKEYGSLPEPWHYGNRIHWRYPFGVYNIMDDGGSTDLDEYLNSGSEIGLERTETLFGELA